MNFRAALQKGLDSYKSYARALDALNDVLAEASGQISSFLNVADLRVYYDERLMKIKVGCSMNSPLILADVVFSELGFPVAIRSPARDHSFKAISAKDLETALSDFLATSEAGNVFKNALAAVGVQVER
jgi:hypothetical protein